MPSYTLPQIVRDAQIDRCFVCYVELTPPTFTLEHIIPQWLIKAFFLEQHTLTLSDGSRLKYMNFLVPCCRSCNCYLLSRREKAMKSYLLDEGGKPKEVNRKRSPQQDPQHVFAVWACKIIAALHIYDNILNRRTPLCDFNQDSVPAGEICHLYLRMLRGLVRLRHLELEFPFSLFLFNTLVPSDDRQRFDFQIVPDLEAFYLRAGRWSVLARADGGYLALHAPHFFAPYSDKVLAPLQMEELAAHFFTMARRQARPMLYVRRKEARRDYINYIPTHPTNPFNDPGNIDDFAFYFAWLTQLPRDELVTAERRVTFLHDNAGQFLNVSADE